MFFYFKICVQTLKTRFGHDFKFNFRRYLQLNLGHYFDVGVLVEIMKLKFDQYLCNNL